MRSSTGSLWPDGDLRTISCVCELSLSEEGIPWPTLDAFGACQDITDFRRAQQENLDREKLESIGTLASGIAHDFNNLLGARWSRKIRTGAGGACFRIKSRREELTAILNGAMRGSKIVRSIDDLCGNRQRGERDGRRVADRRGDPSSLLKVSVSKHAVLETWISARTCWRSGPISAQLRRIVLNLVGDQQSVRGDRRSTWRDPGDHEVRMKGAPGLDLSRKAWLRAITYFWRFRTRAAGCRRKRRPGCSTPSSPRNRGGTAWGWRWFTESCGACGGDPYCERAGYRWYHLQVLLPCAETTADADSDAILGARFRHRPFQAFTVLVVEDEDPLRQAVVKTLRKRGFEVLEASDGTTAIELLRASADKIDVILLDMTIPGASSYEVVAEAGQARPDAKVVLTSAYSQEIMMPPMIAPQICGFIRKPFQLDDLIETLRNAAPTTAQPPAKHL